MRIIVRAGAKNYPVRSINAAKRLLSTYESGEIRANGVIIAVRKSGKTISL